MLDYMIFPGDCRAIMEFCLEPESVHCVVTSPPYFGLRDYGVDGQIGNEPTPEDFIAAMVDVFRHVRRVLRDDGTVWLNLGDSYATGSKGGGSTGGKAAAGLHGAGGGGGGRGRMFPGLPDKQLLGIPWRVALALQADGWFLRQDIIWHKPNPMPESVKDRFTRAHEYLFLLTKNPRYFFDSAAVKEPAVVTNRTRGPARHADTKSTNGNGGLSQRPVTGDRNKRDVWTVAPKPFRGAHFATFPPDLIEPCVLAGCPAGGLVYDPFGGSGTTAIVALKHGRRAVLSELNPEYVNLAHDRIKGALS